MNENSFDGFVEARRAQAGAAPSAPLADEALESVVGGSAGPATYGIYDENGRLVGI